VRPNPILESFPVPLEAFVIAATAVIGLVAYPLLQPAWVMVK
jgi:hypothetical protein